MPALAQERPAPTQRVWIAEFAAAGRTQPAPFAQLPAVNKHAPLDLALGRQTATLDSHTEYFRIVCEVQCAFSTTGPATIDDILVPRLVPEYFGLAGGGSISVIAAP